MPSLLEGGALVATGDSAYAQLVAGFTLDELRDVEAHVDRVGFPARYALVMAEIAARLRAGERESAGADAGARAVRAARPRLPRPAKPPQTAFGMTLLWLATFTSFAVSAWWAVAILDRDVLLATLAGWVLGFAAVAWLLALVSTGRRWALAVYAALFVAGLALRYAIPALDPELSALSEVDLPVTAFQVVGLTLLLTRPSREWFAECRTAEPWNGTERRV